MHHLHLSFALTLSLALPAFADTAKPPESDIEVLTEVIDLQAETADDPTATWYGATFPAPVRILALSTARSHRAGGWELVIDHRSMAPVYDSDSDRPWSDAWNSFAGLDSPIRVGLGFRYGVIDDLDVGLYRAGAAQSDTYELDARFQFLHQAQGGLDAAVRAGLTWFSQPGIEDASGHFAQVLANRLLAGRFLLAAAALYHSSSTNGTKFNQDTAWSLALGGGVEVRLTAGLALDAELVSCTAGYCSRRPTYSAGLKYITTRHTFAVLVGNTSYLTADGYITNTDNRFGKPNLGFQITRSH